MLITHIFYLFKLNLSNNKQNYYLQSLSITEIVFSCSRHNTHNTDNGLNTYCYKTVQETLPKNKMARWLFVVALLAGSVAHAS